MCVPSPEHTLHTLSTNCQGEGLLGIFLGRAKLGLPCRELWQVTQRELKWFKRRSAIVSGAVW